MDRSMNPEEYTAAPGCRNPLCEGDTMPPVEHKLSHYMCNLPYPEVKVAVQNLRYASQLTRSYAGGISETTAIMQYLYQETILAQKYPELANALYYIARVEMIHQHLLAKLIFALGGDPRYHNTCDKSCAYWNATYVDYSKTPRMILMCDIEAEKKEITEYRRLIKGICDENVNAVLKRIILDEERHIEILRELLAVFSEPKEKIAFDMGYRRY